MTVHKLRRKSPLDGTSVSRAKLLKQHPGTEAGAATRQHWEPEEVQRFFKALPTPFAVGTTGAHVPNVSSLTLRPEGAFWYPYFFIQYYFGCRLSEPALILDEDVSFKKRLIVIRRLKQAREKEGFSELVYEVDDHVLACVKAARRRKKARHMEDNPFLFASERKRGDADIGAERLSQLRNLDGWQAVSRFTAHRTFQRVARSARVPKNLCHSHVLRHTRAVIMLASGASVEQVQHLLGHSSPRMTQRYIALGESVRSRLGGEVTPTGLIL